MQHLTEWIVSSFTFQSHFVLQADKAGVFYKQIPPAAAPVSSSSPWEVLQKHNPPFS